MLIDPFLPEEPAFSQGSTGVLEIESNPSSVQWLTTVKSCFEAAGWEQVERVPSNATQQIYRYMMYATTPPAPPVPLGTIADPCTGSTYGSPATLTAGEHVTYFMPFDPFRFEAPAACPDRVWFPMGLTNRETADHLATAMTDNSPFDVFVREEAGDPTIFFFDYVAKGLVAWEWDEIYPLIGWGEHGLDGGYYTYQSQTLNGGYLRVRLQDNQTGVFKPAGRIWISSPAILGFLQPWLTIQSSGGGEWQSVFWTPTHCYFHGGPYQFVIWTDEAGRFHSSILASILKMDPPHLDRSNPILIVSSENYDLQTDWQQLMQKLHWEDSISTGFSNQIHSTDEGNTSRSGPTPDDRRVRTPTCIFRGLRNMPLLTLSDTALAQPAYVLLSQDPTGQPDGEQQDYIGGRLWDMAILSDVSMGVGGGMTVMNGRRWTSVTTSLRSTDLRGSLWITSDSDGGRGVKDAWI